MIEDVILIILALAISYVGYWYYTYYYFDKYLKTIPGPKPIPIFGSILEFNDSKSFISVPLKYQQKYGGIYKVMMGFEMNLLITDYDMTEFILKSNKYIDKSNIYNFLHGWLGTGLLNSTGEKWRKRRKMITPTFHFEILKQFVDVYDSNSNILVKCLQKEVGKGSTDIYPFMTLCTLDIICETAMGTSANAQTKAESEYVNAVQTMSALFVERVFNPLHYNSLIYSFSSKYREEKKCVKILHDYTKGVIASRREQLLLNKAKPEEKEDGNEFGTKKRVAFLDLLLQSTIDGKPLTDDDIREEVDTFMFAGHDTTSWGMSCALFCIAANPDVQKKIIEEQKVIFGEECNRVVTHSDLMEMKYLELVIKESLRLYPPAFSYARIIQEDCKYSDDITIRKGTQVNIKTYNMHRDPKVYPDPEKFDPERFADPNLSKRPYSYLPFSAGARNCIGQKFAMLEMKALISKVIRNFEISSVVPEHKMELLGEIVMKSDNGVLIQINKRKW